MSAWSRIKDYVSTKNSVDLYSSVIVEDDLKSKLNVISEAIINRKNNNSFYRNILI